MIRKERKSHPTKTTHDDKEDEGEKEKEDEDKDEVNGPGIKGRVAGGAGEAPGDGTGEIVACFLGKIKLVERIFKIKLIYTLSDRKDMKRNIIKYKPEKSLW